MIMKRTGLTQAFMIYALAGGLISSDLSPDIGKLNYIKDTGKQRKQKPKTKFKRNKKRGW